MKPCLASSTAKLDVLGAPNAQAAGAIHLAGRYGVAIMSVTRAFNELRQAGG